jgi:hypothetical protein
MRWFMNRFCFSLLILYCSHAIVTPMFAYIRKYSFILETMPSDGKICKLIHCLIGYIVKGDNHMRSVQERRRRGKIDCFMWNYKGLLLLHINEVHFNI